MRKYKNPKLESIEQLGCDIISYGEDFLKLVDHYLELFPPTLHVFPFYDGIQVEYNFNNDALDYIEVCFYVDGRIELFHTYENTATEQECQEEFESHNVQNIICEFQNIISKINIYS